LLSLIDAKLINNCNRIVIFIDILIDFKTIVLVSIQLIYIDMS